MNLSRSVFSGSVVGALVITSVASAVDTPLTTQRVTAGLSSPVFLTSPPGDTARLFVVHLVGAAEVEHLLQRQISLLGLRQHPAYFLPALGNGASYLGQFGRDASDGLLESLDAASVSLFIRLAIDEKEIEHRLFAEEVPEFLAVNIGLALLGSAVRGDDQDFGVRLAVLDQFYPFLDEALLRPFARLPDHEIDGGRAENNWCVGR